MSVLVCGSVAFDNIMVFDDQFKNHILPEQIHILSVSFLVPEMRQQFGGCAGNIIYGLNLLGCESNIVATVGKDFSSYAEWMGQCGINQDHILISEEEYTARAFIITDGDGNQITAFHPGAMNQCHLNKVPEDTGATIGLISPEGRDGMISHAQQLKQQGTPFVFDPGQGIQMFETAELEHFVAQADWVACNDYEAKVLCDRTQSTLEELSGRVRALIVTKGAEGSHIYHDGQREEIPSVQPRRIVDPTGCGDAYRAGLLCGMSRGLDWAMTGRIASTMGAIKIEQAGGQGYSFSREEFDSRFAEAFGSKPDF